MHKTILTSAYFICILLVSSFKCVDRLRISNIREIECQQTNYFPFTIKCSDNAKGDNIKDSDIPKDLKNMTDVSVEKKFTSGKNQVFIYQKNGTEDDPFDTGIYIAVYDKPGKQTDSSRLIDLNCDDPNTGSDGSDPKTSVQYVTFKSADSFKVFIQISSEAKGKDTSDLVYKIDASGKIVAK